MKIAGFLCVALAGITTVVDHATAKEAISEAPLKSCPPLKTIDHDKIQPFPQPPPVTIAEKAAVKFKPRLTIKPHLCDAYPAVTRDGRVSGGLRPTGPTDGQCKGNRHGSQVYGRADWYNDKYAILYAWYIPKEEIPDNDGTEDKYNHRHGWQTCAVWLNNPAIKNPTIEAVSVSVSSVFVSKGPPARSNLDGTAVKVRYFRTVSPNHMYANYELELTDVVGGFQDLIMWQQLTDEARCALNLKDWGNEVKMPINDENFKTSLKEAFPSK
ncbi:hypothetical protein KXD40_004663 [Peronospora effusa]|uniref:Uncharacterized protein n=1 Tax=Peronospora effusa TaxID=542832 RepID=A0A3M6V7N6_9STRA|nr:hypothetical protein DD238_008521 [Peronospora effusa]UIZ28167.1 hypothetical protein KXD40_004661 [Peronospora effusa]UIZ28168.1 hypothetical protein KXD40_004663 [Peronospora effusa]CAI5721561.1 unnamed protein product [Peronospora effusa]CAI5721577.1 unnamed protein product [Peronospora effusa]